MFHIRHQITLANGEHISLYGEDYFGDKRVFWETHQRLLTQLLEQVDQTGSPIQVLQLPEELTIHFDQVAAFKHWLSQHHPI
ncbi:MAG: hypothetical protein AB8E82_05020 [Aureispira sp.]